MRYGMGNERRIETDRERDRGLGKRRWMSVALF